MFTLSKCFNDEGEVEESKEEHVEFFKAGKDSAEALDSSKQAFDLVALLCPGHDSYGGPSGIKRFHLIGHDWGARTGYALAALFLPRLKSLTVLSVPFEPGKEAPPKFPQDRAFWYQWLLCTKPGEKKFCEPPAVGFDQRAEYVDEQRCAWPAIWSVAFLGTDLAAESTSAICGDRSAASCFCSTADL